MAKAFDTATTLTAHSAARLKSNGFECAIRYYTRNRGSWKRLKPEEAEVIVNAGLKLVVVYQDRGRTAADFSFTKGEAAGRAAAAYALNEIGQPAGSAIYFAVDYDASTGDIDRNIAPFFEGVRAGFAAIGGADFRIGAYGSGLVLANLLDVDLIDYSWLSMSMGFRGSREFARGGRWTLRQHLSTRIAGVDIDPNDINPRVSDYGAFHLDTEDAAFSPGLPMVGTTSDGGFGMLEETQAMDSLIVAEPMGTPFPGNLLKDSSFDSPDVKRVQEQLNELGYGPLVVDGDFGKSTESAVMEFQSQFSDLEGSPLEIDGKVGKLTWQALFGPLFERPAPLLNGSVSLAERVLAVANSQIGVREQPLGSNRGPEVDEYQRRVGLDPAGRHPWCAAFLYWCFDEAAKDLSVPNVVPKTAGVLRMWRRGINHASVVLKATNVSRNKVKPGMVFFLDFGRGRGHIGIVSAVEGNRIRTIEGNTNGGGTREGIGVFARTRPIKSRKLKGYLLF